MNNLITAPTEFECVNDAGDLIFKISAFDQYCASIEIKSVVTPSGWAEISDQILRCLESMKLEESPK